MKDDEKGSSSSRPYNKIFAGNNKTGVMTKVPPSDNNDTVIATTFEQASKKRSMNKKSQESITMGSTSTVHKVVSDKDQQQSIVLKATNSKMKDDEKGSSSSRPNSNILAGNNKTGIMTKVPPSGNNDTVIGTTLKQASKKRSVNTKSKESITMGSTSTNVSSKDKFTYYYQNDESEQLETHRANNIKVNNIKKTLVEDTQKSLIVTQPLNKIIPIGDNDACKNNNMDDKLIGKLGASCRIDITDEEVTDDRHHNTGDISIKVGKKAEVEQLPNDNKKKKGTRKLLAGERGNMVKYATENTAKLTTKDSTLMVTEDTTLKTNNNKSQRKELNEAPDANTMSHLKKENRKVQGKELWSVAKLKETVDEDERERKSDHIRKYNSSERYQQEEHEKIMKSKEVSNSESLKKYDSVKLRKMFIIKALQDAKKEVERIEKLKEKSIDEGQPIQWITPGMTKDETVEALKLKILYYELKQNIKVLESSTVKEIKNHGSATKKAKVKKASLISKIEWNKVETIEDVEKEVE